MGTKRADLCVRRRDYRSDLPPSHFLSLFGFNGITPRCGGSSCMCVRDGVFRWSLSLRASLPSGIVGMELHRWSRGFHSFPARPASCNVAQKKIKIWQNKQKNTRLCDALTSIESTLWVQQHLHTLRRIFWPSEVVLSVWTRNVRPVACRETTELKDEVTARCAACRLRPSRRWADSWLISVFSCSASLRFHDYLLWTPLFCFNDAKRTRGMKQNRIWTS